MIHIVTSENRDLYGPELALAHALLGLQQASKEGWVDLVVLDDDRADAPETVHLLALDEHMTLEAVLRLDPTQERCLLAERFAEVFADDPSFRTGPEVWETTCLFTTGPYRARTRPNDRSRVAALWTAALELALVNGVERIVGLVDMSLYPDLLASPLDHRLVGFPRPYALGVAAGLEIPVSGALVDRMREAIGVGGPMGYHVDSLDLRAFGDLAGVQRQVIRAQVPQFRPGSPRDEALAADTLYRLNDTSSRDRQAWADRDARPPPERLNA